MLMSSHYTHAYLYTSQFSALKGICVCVVLDSEGQRSGPVSLSLQESMNVLLCASVSDTHRNTENRSAFQRLNLKLLHLRVYLCLLIMK